VNESLEAFHKECDLLWTCPVGATHIEKNGLEICDGGGGAWRNQNLPCALLLQFSDPDVAEAEWGAGVAVGLELDGGGVVFFVEGLADVEGFAF